MHVEKITADTMADALKEVKRLLGGDAVILSTRNVRQRRWLVLRRDVVEVTAGRDLNVRKPRPAPTIRPQPPAAPVMRQTAGAPAMTPAGRAYATNSTLSGSSISPAITSTSIESPGKALLGTAAVQAVANLNFANEIGTLKTMVTDLVKEVRSRNTPSVPEELFDHYAQLVQAEVGEELATDIVRRVHQNARPEQLANPQYLREKVVEQLERLIPLSGPIERKKTTGPHVVALIGPTGVGKTTTIAKLAANLKLREKRSVGLITIDTYRIGAIDQLRKYADLIGITLSVVSNPEDIAGAVQALAHCDYVLIDTAGRSPKDAMKLSELKRFIEFAGVDEVHLVLATTSGQQAAELAMEKFGGIRVDKVIFTKVDEAAQLGVVLAVARKLNKGLSYVTTGQDVPDDIEVGQARRIAKMIVGDA